MDKAEMGGTPTQPKVRQPESEYGYERNPCMKCLEARPLKRW